ncbi:hypothetical protein EON66_12490, partial [archaeon]
MLLPLAVQVNDVPLYVETSTIDFKHCIVGKLYRANLTVRNRGSQALRCSPVIAPAALAALSLSASSNTSGSAGHEYAIEFVPATGYVQARDTASGVDGAFSFGIKFTPLTAGAAARSLVPLGFARMLGDSGNDADALHDGAHRHTDSTAHDRTGANVAGTTHESDAEQERKHAEEESKEEFAEQQLVQCAAPSNYELHLPFHV